LGANQPRINENHIFAKRKQGFEEKGIISWPEKSAADSWRLQLLGLEEKRTHLSTQKPSFSDA
jgi:hypothetical protein